MIELSGISKSFGAKEAVKDLSLKVNDGEILGFIGPNGAGKTTTLRMITGILEADEGQILVDGHDIDREGELAKSCFSYVPDNPELFSGLKALEYLNFIADIYNVENRKEKILTLTKRFGIDSYLNSPLNSFSHGMRQKAIVCGTLLSDPQNWILDEPLTGLDPQSSYDLKQIMKERTQAGKAVLFSTHVLEVAEKLCDRIAIIKEGSLIYVGTLEELKATYPNKDSLEAIFLELTNA